MPLFRRRSAGPEARVQAFWEWWQAEGRGAAERSIEEESVREQFATAMTQRLHTIAELSWELAAGDSSRHVLVLTAEGNAARRATARRLVLAGPDPDETWSYVDTRPPAPDPESVVLGASGAGSISFAQVLVGARKNGNRFDVTVHHPAFPGLPTETRAQVAFLALDTTLGEIDTELWLGEVSATELAPLDGFGLMALRSVVQDLKRATLDADGNPGWVLLQGETADGPLLATARAPLHPLTAPHLDTHVAVVLPYLDVDGDGLPGEEALDALRDFEDRLVRELGASGTVVAQQSTGGVRTLHLYVDSTAGVLPTVQQVARQWEPGNASVHDMHDPSWQAVTHLRT